ncbi:hypothetical protein NEFER03_1213 [Nematocida sp. LUAm3]|nr:hypothetical protein NEFER03_1213 [Nematocida sp. LUAm3]KAI5175822.1 hypothetical protein NEFER02_1691 [Nematocida sp. LUAm2]KAI5178318.1 hypothetical protein NEFER01_1485 [Nematocida sp. LUAm1]
MKRGEVYRELLQRITEVRRIKRGQNPFILLKKEEEKRRTLKRLLEEKPLSKREENIVEVVRNIAERAKGEEWEVLCAIGEESISKGFMSCQEHMEILFKALKKADDQEIGVICGGIKRVLVSKCTEALSILREKDFIAWISEEPNSSIRERKEWALGVALGEALKILDTEEESKEFLNLQKDKETMKSSFLLSLLLDRSNKAYFCAHKYLSLFSEINEREVSGVLYEIERRKVKENEQMDIFDILIRSTHRDTHGVLYPHLTRDTLQRYIYSAEKKEVVVAIEGRNPSISEEQIEHILEKKSISDLLDLLDYSAERRKVKEIVMSVIMHKTSLYNIIPEERVMRVVEILLMEKGKDNEINTIVGKKEKKESIVLDILAKKIYELEEEYKENIIAKKNELLLDRYLELIRVSSSENWRDHVICNGFILLKNFTCSLPKKEIAAIIDEKSFSSEIISLILFVLMEKESNANMRSLIHLAIAHTEVPYTSQKVREHAVLIKQMVEKVETKEEQEFVSSYFVSQIYRIPPNMHKTIMNDPKIEESMWNKAIIRYKTHEELLLLSVTEPQHKEKTFSPTDQNNIFYSNEHILLFLLMHLLGNKHPMQYMQIAEKSKSLIITNPLRNNQITPWRREEKEDQVAYYYKEMQQNLLVEEEDEILKKWTDESGHIYSEGIYQAARQRVYKYLEKESLKSLALVVLTGQTIDVKKESVTGIQKRIEETPELRDILLIYIKNREDHKSLLQIFPELQQEAPSKHLLKEPVPAQRLPRERRRERQHGGQVEIEIEKKEDLRKQGMLLAHRAVARKDTFDEEDGISSIPVGERTKEELSTMSRYFFEEMLRFWKKDKEKISKHFDKVIEYSSLFITEKEIIQIEEILKEYFKCSYSPIEEAFTIAHSLIVMKISQSPINQLEKELDQITKVFGSERRLVDKISTIFSEQSLPKDTLSVCIKKEETLLFFSAMLYLAEHPEREEYQEALSIAFSSLQSRDDDVLYYSLFFLKRSISYSSNPETFSMVVNGAFRILFLRTKLDQAGECALEIVQEAIFKGGYSPSRREIEDLLCTAKYDLYHYQHLLLYFINDLPIEELLEIISKINTPEARSARPIIKKVIMQYTCEKRDGIRICSALFTQASLGASQDKLFIIEIIRDTLQRYGQGAWLTLFLQTAEALANETEERVCKALLSLLEEVITSSANRKQFKKLYIEWKEKPKLYSLVKKISSLFL